MKSFLTIVSLFFVLVIVVFVEWHLDTPGRADQQRSILLGGGSGTEHRVEAVGRIKVESVVENEIEEAVESSAEQSVSVEVSSIDGESIYNAGCVACHGAGIAGAPRVGDIDEWLERVSAGMDVVMDHAINGYQGSKGMMPAKGGNPSLSDDEVKAAVEYMVAASQ